MKSEIFKYDLTKYNFHDITCKIFNDFPESMESIHDFHNDRQQVTFQNDTKTMFQSMFYNSSHYKEFLSLYYSFVKEYIFPLFPNETALVVQKDPCFRVCTPDNTALGMKDGEDEQIGMHCDADYNHPEQEVNFILAITEMWESNSVYIESEPGKGDFQDLRLSRNEFYKFLGNKCRHYNMKNKTGQSRVSIDFRVIPYSKYDDTYSKTSVHGNRKLIVGEYFLLMNKDIELVKKYWNERPCNIRHSSKEVGTREYFEEVTSRKYFVEKHILEFADFKKYSGKRVLEIGCGIGTAAQSFIENGANYTGVDISETSIELAKKRMDVFQLKGELYVANIENIEEFDTSISYDLIYSFGVLHHTPYIEKAIENIWKLLKPGGECKLMLYAKNSLKYFEIKDGLDQYEAQSGVPIANVYTNEEIHKLLYKFRNIDIKQDHIFPYKIEEYKQYKYVKKDYFQAMPEPLFRCLEKNLGWHLCIRCTK